MRYRELVEGQTDSAAFQRWFGASKVVDAQGRPLRMYHGTAHAHITAFEVGYNSSGHKQWTGNHTVISFTSDPAFANGYAGDHADLWRGRSPVVYPVYLRSLNPGDFRNPEHCQQVMDWLSLLKERFFADVKQTHGHIWTPDRIDAERQKSQQQNDLLVRHGAWQVWEQPGMWQKFGWDGAWSREEPNHRNAAVLNFAVADGKQVKSAVGNSGAFDPASASFTETVGK